jgi:hypothetical protein
MIRFDQRIKTLLLALIIYYNDHFINYRHQVLMHMEAVLRINRLGWFPAGCKVYQAHCAP